MRLASTNPEPHRVLKLDLKDPQHGEDVRALQVATMRRLSARGIARDLQVDGEYGPATAAACDTAAHFLGALDTTVKSPVLSVGAQRMIRYPGQRAPEQLARAKARVDALEDHRDKPVAAAKGAVQRALAAFDLAYRHAPEVHYTMDGRRWQGIRLGLRADKGQYPRYADCSSMFTWCYWQALGDGADIINGQSWDAGYCVPEGAECLTRAGWKPWSELQPGVDETLGYNPVTKQNEWTPIESVHVFEDQQTVTMNARGWSATVTPHHRWSVDRAGDDLLVPTNELRQSHQQQSDSRLGDMIRLAAVAEDGEGIDITPAEAAVLGWLACDGSVRSLATGKCRPLGIRPTSRTLPVDEWGGGIGRATVWQSKPAGVSAVRSALIDVPHTEHVRETVRDGANYIARSFELQPAWVRDVALRAEIPQRGLVGTVLAMSAECRAAFLDGCIAAEGHVRTRTRTGADGYTRTSHETTFVQKPGPVLEAVKLAMYLGGKRPGRANVRQGCAEVRSCRPGIRAGSVKITPGERQTMWCPHTGLGTWTMRLDGQVMLTGNTGTLLTHGQRIHKPEPGCAVIYGRAWPGVHVAMYDKNGMCYSHGSEAAPFYVNYRYRSDILEMRRYA